MQLYFPAVADQKVAGYQQTYPGAFFFGSYGFSKYRLKHVLGDTGAVIGNRNFHILPFLGYLYQYFFLVSIIAHGLYGVLDNIKISLLQVRAGSVNAGLQGPGANGLKFHSLCQRRISRYSQQVAHKIFYHYLFAGGPAGLAEAGDPEQGLGHGCYSFIQVFENLTVLRALLPGHFYLYISRDAGYGPAQVVRYTVGQHAYLERRIEL